MACFRETFTFTCIKNKNGLFLKTVVEGFKHKNISGYKSCKRAQVSYMWCPY